MPRLHRPDPQVLLLTQREDRVLAVASAMVGLGPEWLMECTRTASQAARLALRGHLQLMLIDAAGLTDGGIGLAHHLARWRPELPLLVLLDDQPARSGPARYARWETLEPLLRSILTPSPGSAPGPTST